MYGLRPSPSKWATNAEVLEAHPCATFFPQTALLGSSIADRGLTADEVEQRQRLYDSNDILGDRRSGWGNIARDTAQDPMVWPACRNCVPLRVARGLYRSKCSCLSAGADKRGHGYLSAPAHTGYDRGIGRSLGHASASKLRDGGPRDIPSAELVPGDLVIVNEGEFFPADGVLVAGVNLQADEFALTGEAMPVRKRPFKGAAGKGETSLDNEYWGAAGTRLLTGEARLRVVFTGGETLYGEIVRFAREGGMSERRCRAPLASLSPGSSPSPYSFALLLPQRGTIRASASSMRSSAP